MSDDTIGKTALACTGAVVVLVVTVALMAILNGWVLSILWEWFIVPTFGTPSLTIPVAIGISLIVSMFKSSKKKNKFDEDKTLTYTLVEGIGSPIVALSFGYLVHLFL